MKIVYATKKVDGKDVRYYKVLEDKVCLVCGEKFIPKRVDSTCCSRKCGRKKDTLNSKEKNSKRSRLWYKDNIKKARATRNKYYLKNADRERKRKREWYQKNKAHKKEQDKKYKDGKRHGNKREDTINKDGLICSKCGIEKTDSFDIVMHHKTFNNQEHEEQELLCRSCHATIHMNERLKI